MNTLFIGKRSSLLVCLCLSLAPAQDSEEYRGVIGADVVAGVGAGVAQTIYDYLDSGSVNWERTKNRAISVGIGGSVGYGVSKVFSWAKGILGW